MDITSRKLKNNILCRKYVRTNEGYILQTKYIQPFEGSYIPKDTHNVSTYSTFVGFDDEDCPLYLTCDGFYE